VAAVSGRRRRRAGAPVAGPAPKALRRKAPELAGGLARCDKRYGDFGPPLAAEYLALDDTFKKAPESKKKQGRQTELGV
jgi:hypothetical protein